MSALALSSLIFVLALGGILLGTLLRRALPEHHLSENSQDAVRLGVGLIATISALVLGLLIAAAKTSFDTIQSLSPQNDLQRSLQARAAQLSTDLVQTRLILFAEAGNAIPTPFLLILVLWIVIIFASFSLFSDLNVTVFTCLSLFALSASGAIFLILELGKPFSGLMMISSEPLRHALGPL